MHLLTILRVKLYFLFINPVNVLRAKYRLWQYVRTLRPEQQAYARELQAKLKIDNPVRVLRAETARLNEQWARVTERIDRVQRSL